MTTKTLLGKKAHQAILNGVNAVYSPVKRTIGPEGKNGLLYGTYGQEPRITNCGNIIGGVQEPKDVHVRLVANAFQETCKKTDEKVGDGRTATIVLGGKLYNEAYKQMAVQEETAYEGSGNLSVQTIKKQIIETANDVKKDIRKVAKKIENEEDLVKIATVSVEDKKIGEIIGKMSYKTGLDSFLDVVEGFGENIETEMVPDVRFPAKIGSKGFMNHPAIHKMIATDCPIIITNYDLDNVPEVSAAVKEVYNKYKKIIIVAKSFSDQVLQMLWASMLMQGPKGTLVRNGLEFYPVACPSLRSEQMEDLAVYCDSRFINKDKGERFENIKPNDTGFLERLVVMGEEAKEDARAFGGDGVNLVKMKLKEKDAGFSEGEKERKETPVQQRIKELKSQLKLERKGKMFESLLKRRISSLCSSSGVIRVGGATKNDIHYKKLKIQDAVNSCKAALKSGYVKGGGLCLKEIADKLPDENIMKLVLQEPYRLIQASGNIKITDDIIDPADVMYYSVEHSTSVVANLITVDIITAEEEPINPVYGSLAIANSILEIATSDKIAKGQIKASEQEIWKEAHGGLTEDESDYFRDE